MAVDAPEVLDSLLSAPEYLQDPYPVYARLRTSDPVHWCAPWGQWVVTRHEDVAAILRQPDLLSSSGWEERFLGQLPPESVDELPTVMAHYRTKVVSNTDPPEHTRLREIISRSFTPRVVAALREPVSALVDEMLDELAGEEKADLIARFAYPLPATVIALLLGAPAEDRHLFEQWSYDIVSFVGTGSPDLELARREEASLARFRSYLDELIERRRRDPRDDLLSLLISRSDDGAGLTHDELVSTCITLLFAGHETTANLIGNLMLALLRHPDQWRRLAEEPELARTAVEEALRYDSPVQRVRRVARRDFELGGRRIRQGELVMGFLGAANRDPAVFDDPDRFDVTRKANNHTAFGGGVHFCLGAALSRLEGPLAVNALVQRFPWMRLPDDAAVRFRPNMTFRGLDALIVELAP